MTRYFMFAIMLLLLLSLMIMPAAAQTDEFVFGMLLTGAPNDRGWNQAHYEGGCFVLENIPNTRMILYAPAEDFDPIASVVVESVTAENCRTLVEESGENPPIDISQIPITDIVSEMAQGGAQLVFITSDVLEAAANSVGTNHPTMTFIAIGADSVLAQEAPANVGNLMVQMEWGKMIAGCAAALATQTGSIGYIGAADNAEGRRLASSAFLAANYCYTTYRPDSQRRFVFTVYWLTGQDINTLTTEMLEDDMDIIISSVDGAVVLEAAAAFSSDAAWAMLQGHADHCNPAPQACLGAVYYNWGPAYVPVVQAVEEQTWVQQWQWLTPDLADSENSLIGYAPGEGLSEADHATLQEFIDDLAAYAANPFVPFSFPLWQGPLRLQDGTDLAFPGEMVDYMDVWYLTGLVEGISCPPGAC
jgi:simple sugar transport system substrate-binding protein